MAKLGILRLTGKSGNKYNFDVYPSNTSWNDGFACVYYISKRVHKSDGTGNHTAIYVGETSDLKDRLANHHKQSCFDGHDYNAVSIHQPSNEQSRLQIESDLISALGPPCND